MELDFFKDFEAQLKRKKVVRKVDDQISRKFEVG